MKKLLKSAIKKITNKLGYKILNIENYKQLIVNNNTVKSNTHAKNNLLDIFFTNIITIGFTPKHIVDIGANHGTWTREALKYFPEAYYTLLEPQKWLKKSFQDILDTNSKVQFYPVGAGKDEGSFQFTIVNRDDSCSFRYTKQDAKQAGFKQIEIQVVTLNKLLEHSKAPTPDIIKIDAEGLDLEVLKGASNFFGKTEIFMVEAGVVNKIFDNSFFKVINFMDENNYRLFDMTDLNRPFPSQVLWLVELVFVKKNGFFDKMDFKPLV